MLRLLGKIISFFTGAFLAGLAVLIVAVAYAYPKLPPLEDLEHYEPLTPLRIYTADGVQVGEFGRERRIFIPYQEIPETLINAIVAAEDERFFSHPGVDIIGVLRAGLSNLRGGKLQGASTLTQQLARNTFLTKERSYQRKFYEALLAIKIERNLSKEKILEIYINHIFLGQRSYGFAVAAQTYFGRPLNLLSVGEIAMLAGLPKGPSSNNPIRNYRGAVVRQRYVLKRMLKHNFISEQEYADALNSEIVIYREPLRFPSWGGYIAEMARLIALNSFPKDAYTRGLNIILTVTSASQTKAHNALLDGAYAYQLRHDYQGPEGEVALDKLDITDAKAVAKALNAYPTINNLWQPVIVLERRKNQLVLIDATAKQILAEKAQLKQLAGYKPNKEQKPIVPGSVVYLYHKKDTDANAKTTSDDTFEVTNSPYLQGALVSLDPRDGEIIALAGGLDYSTSVFNHATQAWRQPGSSFKPFVYSAALENGFAPGAILPDEPLSIQSNLTGGELWTPKNYDGRYAGFISLRRALAKSKNMVSIRLLMEIGVPYARAHTLKFGFVEEKVPPFLAMALGAGSVTPWQMATAYAIFANGGYAVHPYLIKEMRDGNDKIIARPEILQAGDEQFRVINERNVFIMDSMLREVTTRGTASTASRQLKRKDIAGKTGTTNDFIDAWFAGYQKRVVSVVWVGFDEPKNMGRGESGTKAALPIWIDFMDYALQDVPEEFLERPTGIITANTLDPQTGSVLRDYFYAENAPVFQEPLYDSYTNYEEDELENIIAEDSEPSSFSVTQDPVVTMDQLLAPPPLNY